jgi:aminobenzoyl-glutamate utilization protein B
MRVYRTSALLVPIALIVMSASLRTQSVATPAATSVPPTLAAYKTEAAAGIDGMYDFAQQMVDSVFRFSELGFQEFETQRYLTGILEQEGFTIPREVAGIPSACG